MFLKASPTHVVEVGKVLLFWCTCFGSSKSDDEGKVYLASIVLVVNSTKSSPSTLTADVRLIDTVFYSRIYFTVLIMWHIALVQDTPLSHFHNVSTLASAIYGAFVHRCSQGCTGCSSCKYRLL